jgi:hypothetical protein
VTGGKDATVPDREPLTFIGNGAGEAPPEAPHTNGAVTTSGIMKTRSIRRRVFIGLLVVFVALWAFALTYSVTAGGRSPERLTNPDAHVAETACVDAQHKLSALPQVGDKAALPARATRLASEDALLRSMVSRLRALHPTGKTPAIALTGWLDDWNRLIAARDHYVHDLRTIGNTARFVEPATAGVDPIVDKMNNWILEQGTRTNACNTGELQAEVIYGPRVYGPASTT